MAVPRLEAPTKTVRTLKHLLTFDHDADAGKKTKKATAEDLDSGNQPDVVSGEMEKMVLCT